MTSGHIKCHLVLPVTSAILSISRKKDEPQLPSSSLCSLQEYCFLYNLLRLWTVFDFYIIKSVYKTEHNGETFKLDIAGQSV